MTVQSAHALDKQQNEGMEDFGEEFHDGAHAPAERQGMMRGIYLGEYFAKKKQQKGQEDGLTHENEPSRIIAHRHHLGKKVTEQHDDGNIHEVVAYQYGCHQVLLLLKQFLDKSISIVFVLVKLVEVTW